MRSSEIAEWRLFLGASDTKVAANELHRLVTRLDEAFDIINYVVKLLTGSPGGGYAEESLVVSRATLTEAIQQLNDTRAALDSDDPEVA